MIRFVHKGNFKKTEKFLSAAQKGNFYRHLEEYGQRGVMALASMTPIESGKTALSWDYEIVHNAKGISIYWKNSNIQNGVNIAVILQYGHGTGTGGYVQGRDYINPAIRPIFDEIAEQVWKEVTTA